MIQEDLQDQDLTQLIHLVVLEWIKDLEEEAEILQDLTNLDNLLEEIEEDLTQEDLCDLFVKY